jgi:hypothetical protein
MKKIQKEKHNEISNPEKNNKPTRACENTTSHQQNLDSKV